MKLENTWLLEVPEVQGFSANHLPPQKYPQNETSQTMILGDKGDWGTTIQILSDQGPPKKKGGKCLEGLANPSTTRALAPHHLSGQLAFNLSGSPSGGFADFLFWEIF